MRQLALVTFLAAAAGGLAAWEKVYSVLTSQRCINCHTATSYPQQGDDRRRHFANVIRGPKDKGVIALNCARTDASPAMIPVIFITAHRDESVRLALLEALSSAFGERSCGAAAFRPPAG